MKTPTKKLYNALKPVPAVGVCGALLITGALGAKKTEKPDDKRISNAIESSLLFESSVPSYLVDVEVADGIAILSGTVDNLLAEKRAIRVAKAIRGVRSVIDKLDVDIPSVDDQKLAKDVSNALLLDPATESYEIDVEADEGVVTLSGTVDSWQEKQLALHIAKGVRGVKDIVNDMVHSYDQDRPDSEITAEVRRAMDIDVILRGLIVHAEAKDGEVILSGNVGSVAEKDRAISKAWVTGVSKVNADDLTVNAWAGNDMKKKQLPVLKSDEEIRKAVEDALVYDPRVFSFNPDVTVDLGNVTLSGTVSNLKAKQAAERDARNTVGVWSVTNLLKVRTPKPISDAKILRNLDTALALNAITESYEIDAEIQNGVVTLDGTVDSYMEKFEAEDVANRTNGVLLVRNNLTVDYPDLTYYSYSYDPNWSMSPYYGYNTLGETTWPEASDAEIIRDIEDEFFWSPFVDGDDIDIAAKYGVVTLTGKVEDSGEYRAATENAFEGGAKEVINNLTLK